MESRVKTEPRVLGDSCDVIGANYEDKADARSLDDSEPGWKGWRSQWGIEETRNLLQIWGEKSIQDDLRTTKHNRSIYERVQARMAALGYNRTVRQLHDKCKNLSVDYRKAKRHALPGTSERVVFKFYNELDRILGEQAAGSSSGVGQKDDSTGTSAAMGEDYQTEDNSYSSSSPKETDRVSYTEPETPTRTVEKQITYSPSFIQDSAIRSQSVPRQIWSDSETFDLLHIWGRDTVQTMLKSVRHNRNIYEEIQVLMTSLGYERTVKQIQDKCKSLCVEYRRARRTGADDMSRRFMFRFYDKLDSIIGHEVHVDSPLPEQASPVSEQEMKEMGGHSPFQSSLTNRSTTMNGTGVKRLRMEDSESDGEICEMISPQPKIARVAPGKRFFALKATGSVFQSENWQPRGETLYQPLQHEVLINTTNIEQVSFSEGLAFVGNEAGAYVSTERGHMIHLWRYDDRLHKLYISQTFLFTNYQAYSEVREILEQL